MAKVKITGHASGSGVFTITAPNSNTDRTITLPDASVTLGTDATKLPLAGGTMTGNTIHTDSSKDIYGTDSDLEMYHSGSHAYITNTTGDLIISDAGGDITIQAKTGENSIVARDDGGVELYHNDVKRIETTSVGTLTTAGNGADGTPAIDATVSLASDARGWATRILSSNIGSSKYQMHWIGQASSNKNSGYMAYYWDSSASNNNALTFGHHGAYEQLKLTAGGLAISQYTAQAWVSWAGVNTVGIHDSHNISSIDDLGVGQYRVNIARDMAGSNYVKVGSITESSRGNMGMGSAVAASFLVYARESHTGDYTDYGALDVLVFGDS